MKLNIPRQTISHDAEAKEFHFLEKVHKIPLMFCHLLEQLVHVNNGKGRSNANAHS